MKHVILRFIVMGIGITTAVPAALAGGNNGGDVCYVDGVACGCVKPAPVYLYPAPNSGIIAGVPTPGSIDTSRENRRNLPLLLWPRGE
jgi:hypothetical protein